MEGREGEAAASKYEGKGSRGMRKRNKLAENDKENLDIYEGSKVASNQAKSPLPEGYPRLALQDITAVLQNSVKEEASNGTLKFSKFPSHSPGSKTLVKMKKTSVFAERASKQATRADPRKPRKSQALMKLGVGGMKSMTTAQTNDQEAINLANAVFLTEQTNDAQTVAIVQVAAEEARTNYEEVGSASDSAGSLLPAMQQNMSERMGFTVATLTKCEERRAALEKPKDSSVSSVKKQRTQDQKRQKPLSSRSIVSSFR